MGGERVTSVLLYVQGTRSVAKLAVRLSEIKGVVSVKAGDANVTTDI